MHCTFGARCSPRYWRGYERVRDVGAVACKVVQVEQRPAAGGTSEVWASEQWETHTRSQRLVMIKAHEGTRSSSLAAYVLGAPPLRLPAGCLPYQASSCIPCLNLLPALLQILRRLRRSCQIL